MTTCNSLNMMMRCEENSMVGIGKFPDPLTCIQEEKERLLISKQINLYMKRKT